MLHVHASYVVMKIYILTINPLNKFSSATFQSVSMSLKVCEMLPECQTTLILMRRRVTHPDPSSFHMALWLCFAGLGLISRSKHRGVH